jgi:hypothetical protein
VETSNSQPELWAEVHKIAASNMTILTDSDTTSIMTSDLASERKKRKRHHSMSDADISPSKPCPPSKQQHMMKISRPSAIMKGQNKSTEKLNDESSQDVEFSNSDPYSIITPTVNDSNLDHLFPFSSFPPNPFDFDWQPLSFPTLNNIAFTSNDQSYLTFDPSSTLFDIQQNLDLETISSAVNETSVRGSPLDEFSTLPLMDSGSTSNSSIFTSTFGPSPPRSLASAPQERSASVSRTPSTINAELDLFAVIDWNGEQ